eukprot:CAMPEP_0201711174 /NCGR_PEP_ID=MMETSP0578-20130828/59006_1 /ASSEMBLY_ACC=CAM_ASM_000663 /TAXON_ID=267565 /ORGANISM="Skeletonema grethea, Strain CCMP 1804" /LENGTH=816 /DNA_ID=CAMNT_0048200223 /DNA_START=396 /DNA_END=2843 /DNA_ORIENTATION=+
MSNFLYNPSNIQLKNSLTTILQNIRDNYSGETDIVVSPGDVVSFGPMRGFETYMDLTGKSDENEAVYDAAMTSYTMTNEVYQGAGFSTYIPCIGDHEIGGNEGFVVSGKNSKLASIPTHRQGWIDSFMRDENGLFKFNEVVAGVSSRPSEESGFQGTSYAYRRNNSLFISVDVFKIMNGGVSNYYDRSNGYGGEGAITCTLEGLHATWFESVLKAAREDISIKHIFVEAHVPILHPVRKARCSGQFLDDQTDSTFWRLMEEYNVDAYFAGEVHAVTVSKSKVPGSNLLQIVSRGNSLSSFLSVNTTDDTIEIKQYREVGPKKNFNNDYVQSGLLTIDKTDPSNPQISSSGELKVLDDEVALMHFDFEGTFKIDARPIHAMDNEDSLVAKYKVLSDTNCTESIHNMGSFGEQYDAQVANIELVPGRKAGTYAGKFAPNSRFGVFSMGPYTAGMAHSIAMWMKTSEASKKMTLLYFGPRWNPSQKDTLQVMLQNGELHYQFAERGAKFELAKKKILADDQWHHVAVVMPFDSCKYSQVQLFIDGVLCETMQTRGSDEHVFFYTAGRLDIGYGYRKDFDSSNGFVNTFEGEIDDVMIWSKPLEKQDILRLWDNGSDPSNPNPGPQDESKTIVCGKGEGCDEGDSDVASIHEIHEIRCCRDCDRCSSPWKQMCPKYNPSLFALSKINGVCKQGTFLEANDLCRSLTNGRLCTPLELQNGCAKNTGCNFNWEMIWACAYDGHECKEDTECCGSCVNGKCEGGGERDWQDQDQVVPRLENEYGPEALILAEGPHSSSTCHLNVFWILNLSLLVWMWGFTAVS